MVDIDPQGNATSGVGVEKGEVQHCVYAVLIGGMEIQEVIRPTEVRGLGNRRLPRSPLPERRLSWCRRCHGSTGSSAALEPVVEEYDYILIDSPPSLRSIDTEWAHGGKRCPGADSKRVLRA